MPQSSRVCSSAPCELVGLTSRWCCAVPTRPLAQLLSLPLLVPFLHCPLSSALVPTPPPVPTTLCASWALGCPSSHPPSLLSESEPGPSLVTLWSWQTPELWSGCCDQKVGKMKPRKGQGLSYGHTCL